MNFDFDTLDKNIASAATDIIEEAEQEFWYYYNNNREPQKEAVFVTREELSSIVREMVFEILEPIKNDIDKIAKKVNILSKDIKDIKQDIDGLKAKMDEIYEPNRRERKAAAAARIQSGVYDKLEQEANNIIPEGDE